MHVTKAHDVDIAPVQARQVVDYFLEDFQRFGYSTDSYLGRECRMCMLLCMLLLVRVYVSVDVSAGGVYVIVYVVAGACVCQR